MLENRNIRKMILIPESTDAKLKELSETKGWSQNEIINRSLEAYLKRFNLEGDKDE